jgi:hypothetical protein
MKKLIVILIALLPLMTMAGNPKGEKKENKVDIKITTKNGEGGQLEIKIDGKDLKKLEEELNKALKNVSIKIDDGTSKHEIQFKAEIKTE